MKKVVLSVLLLSSVAPVMAENNFSSELLLGTAHQDLLNNGFATSDNDMSFGARGAYSLNKNFSVEAAYQNYGEADYTYTNIFGDNINNKLSSTAINFGIKGILPLNNDVSLNARVGVSFWDAEITETNASFTGVTFQSDDGNDLYYGIGVQYQIDSHVFLGLEYTMIKKMSISNEGGSTDFDVENTSLSLGYNF